MPTTGTVVNGAGTGGTALTLTPDCSGSDRALAVYVFEPADDLAPTATYDGVSLDQEASLIVGSGVGRVFLFTLVNPTAGVNDLVVNPGHTSTYHVVAIPLSGVDQSTPFGAPVTAKGSDGGSALDVSSALDDLILDGFTVHLGSFRDLVEGLSQTNLAEENISDDRFGVSSADGEAGSTAMEWSIMNGGSLDTGKLWAHIGIAVKPAAAGATTVEPGFIASTAEVFEPAIVETDAPVTIAPTFIASVAAVYEPTISEGVAVIGISDTLRISTGPGTSTAADNGTAYAMRETTEAVVTTAVGADGSFEFTGLTDGARYHVWGVTEVDDGEGGTDEYTTQVHIMTAGSI